MLSLELKSSSEFSWHVISFYWEGFQPHLIAYDEESETLRELPLFGQLSLEISKERRCVGFEDDEGYHPCPHGRKVASFQACRSCSSSFLPDQRCVFEPKCEGDLCDHPEFCVRDHVVYLAFYGMLMKVGMTSERRLRERAIEQGADAVTPIYRCKGRQQARLLEREVSRRFKINQEFRAKSLLGQLSREVPWKKIEAKYRNTLIRLSMWKEPLNLPLSRLEGYPLPNRGIQVQLEAAEGSHAGKIIGVKGKYLIYEADERLHALDLSDLPSRYLTWSGMPETEQATAR